jgi:putative hydrolase of the HAD superfamily
MRRSSPHPDGARPRRAIVLDLDDTLYLERDYVRSGFRAAGAWLGAQTGCEGFAAAAGRAFDEGVRGRIFDEALIALGIDPAPRLVARLVEVYRHHRPAIRLAPDAERFLARSRRGHALALITDGWRVPQKRKIAALGLHRRGIRLAICTDRWGPDHWKPSTRSFLHVQAYLALPPSCCIYIADNPAKDFIAPRALGWKSVRIARPERLHLLPGGVGSEADHVVKDLDLLSDSEIERIFHT